MSQAAPKRLGVAGTFRASQGVGASVLEAMDAMASASRAEDGCEDYSYAIDVFDPTLIRVFEIWRDRAAFLAHREMPHLAAWRAKWPDLGLGQAALKKFDIDNEAAV